MTEHRQHTPAEAVRYWYDAATERRQEIARLRAVLARIGQMADHWEQKLPEVIRTPAVVSAIRAALEPAAVSAVRPPATDRTALREQVAEAIRAAACPGDCGKTEEECARERIQPFAWHHGRLAVVEGEPEMFADAVLAVLPAPAARAALVAERDALGREADRLRKDWVEMRTRAERAEANRAAVLREAADRYEEILASASAEHSSDPRYYTGVRDVILGLRRLAAEAAVSGRADDETGADVRCSAATFNRPHGPHRWEPQPGMDPVRCPGACRCEHPDDEHSVYGCAEDCSCEYLPTRTRPAVGGAQPKEAEGDRIVAYRHPATGALFCVRCAPRNPGDIWTSVTAEELKDGGICVGCGTDVLIPQQPKEAGA